MVTMARTERTWDEATRGSAELFERAQAVLPGGVNSPVRGASVLAPVPGLPRAWRRGATCSTSTATSTSTWSWASGPIILGHDHPAVAGAVAEQASRGSVFATCTPLEVEVAEQFCDDGRLGGAGPLHELGHRVDDARPAPGARVHGQAQDPQVRGSFPRQPRRRSSSASRRRSRRSARPPIRCASRTGPGIPPEHYETTLVAVWNDLEALERVIRRHRDELAAVIVEPVMANKGYIGPEPGYLEGAATRSPARTTSC